MVSELAIDNSIALRQVRAAVYSRSRRPDVLVDVVDASVRHQLAFALILLKLDQPAQLRVPPFRGAYHTAKSQRIGMLLESQATNRTPEGDKTATVMDLDDLWKENQKLRMQLAEMGRQLEETRRRLEQAEKAAQVSRV
jgi:hypothetical protein